MLQVKASQQQHSSHEHEHAAPCKCSSGAVCHGSAVLGLHEGFHDGFS